MQGMFSRGLTPYLDLAKPCNGRLLLRAVLATDGVEVGGSLLHTAGTDARQAICHQIVDYAFDCEQTWYKGDFVLHISTAGDGVDEEQGHNKDNRYVFVDEKDIVMVLSRDDAEKHYWHLQQADEHRRRVALGLPLEGDLEEPGNIEG